MKFLCENCKAKYQIGDDKVAGKTVRMKCRRCGFDIHVNASAILEETSASSWPDASATMQGSMAIVTPEAAAAMGLRPASSAASKSAPTVASPRPVPALLAAPRPAGVLGLLPSSAVPRAAPAPRVAPPSSTWPAEPADLEEESTSVMSVPLHVAVAAAQAATSADAPRPPMASTAPSTREVAATPRPAPAATPRPAGLPRPAVAAPPRARTAASPTDPAKSSPGSVGPTPVAGALAEQPAATSTQSEDWYVGVAGTAIGPTNLTVIREKARTGEIHADSLVWREGQGEWLPLRNFRELLEAVTSGNAASLSATSVNSVNAARVASLASNVLAATPTPAPYNAAAEPEPAPLAASPFAAAPSPAPSLESSSISAFSSPLGRGSAATAVLTDIFPTQSGSSFDAPEPLPSGATNGTPHATHPILDSFAAVPTDAAAEALAGAAPIKAPSLPDGAAGGFASGTGGPPIEIDASVVPRRRNPPHPMAYAFIAFAAVFGGVAAYVLLSKPQQIVVVQTAPTVGIASNDPKTEKLPASAEVVVGEPTTDSTSAGAVRPITAPGTGGPRPKASSTAGAAPIDTTGFTSTIPGPSTAQAPPSVAGGQLSQGEIQGVVAQNQSIVKRKCWQPALESRAANAPTNARVNGTITIGASGNVESASASGGERDFPGLSSCIASRMKSWKFPPSGSSTPVNVPFVFAGQ